MNLVPCSQRTTLPELGYELPRRCWRERLFAIIIAAPVIRRRPVLPVKGNVPHRVTLLSTLVFRQDVRSPAVFGRLFGVHWRAPVALDIFFVCCLFVFVLFFNAVLHKGTNGVRCV